MICYPNILDTLKGFCQSDRFQFIINFLNSSKINYEIQDYQKGKNIICHFGSKNYENIIGAHYDCIPGVQGANDNGASVVEMLWAIKNLSKNKFKGNMTFVFYDHEEYLAGLGSVDEMGSMVFAKMLSEKNIIPNINVILDVCGVGEIIALSEGSLCEYQAGIIDDCARGIERFSGRVDTPPSDNYSFTEYGIPSVLLVTLSVDDYIQDGYPDSWSKLHTKKDSVEENIEENTLNWMSEFLEVFSKNIS
jgi:hypothetical protein